VHEVKELKENNNFIIKGNNLVVLHGLKKKYIGKVKCIYRNLMKDINTSYINLLRVSVIIYSRKKKG